MLKRLGLGLVGGLMALWATDASAVVALTLEDPGSDIFQQTMNSPCVIGEPSCNNPGGFGFSTIPSNTSPYDVTSPTYTVSQISTLLGTSTFFVGIDVNTAQGQATSGATEVLEVFQMLVNGIVEFEYTGSTAFSNANNGNGFSDALLKTFDLSGFNAGDSVTFRAVVSSATDGREQFFLVATDTPPVLLPEPSTVGLIGTGVLMLGLMSWLRRRAA